MTASSRLTSMPDVRRWWAATASRSPGYAGRHRVAEDLLVEETLGLFAHRPRRARRRLAGHEVHQVAVGELSPLCCREQVHHVEGRHVRALRDLHPVSHGHRLGPPPLLLVPRASPMSRSSTRAPSLRSPLCRYSSVSHGASPAAGRRSPRRTAGRRTGRRRRSLRHKEHRPPRARRRRRAGASRVRRAGRDIAVGPQVGGVLEVPRERCSPVSSRESPRKSSGLTRSADHPVPPSA